MTEIVGVLRNARRVANGEDPRAPCLSGEVYGDIKGRFRDGERVTTSTIMSEEGDVFRTRFSVYRVESWADGSDTAAADWLEWGPRKENVGPVDGKTLVDVRFRNGNEYFAEPAWGYEWNSLGDQYDIVAYRVSKDEGK